MLNLIEGKKIGLVVYTDGGAIPNPGFSGYGVHGYFFDYDEKEKGKVSPVQNPFRQGQKNQTFYVHPTRTGYVSSTENEAVFKKNPIVKPLAYLDIVDYFDDLQTNNVAELTGLLMALRKASEVEGLTSFLALMDSQYVRDIMTSYMHGWRKNNWLKSDGTPPKNLELIQELDHHQQTLKDKGCRLEYAWVRGHSGDLGNGMADYYASIAVRIATSAFREDVKSSVDRPVLNRIESPKGYWDKETDRHPFLDFKRTYFNRVRENNEPGHYFLIQPSETDLTIGKRANEAYAVVRLAKPCPMMENVISAQGRYGQHENKIILGLMDRIYSRFVVKFSEAFGEFAFFNSNNQRELLFCDMSPVALEHNPPLLIYRSAEIFLHLDRVLDAFLKKTGKAEETEADYEPFEIAQILDITEEFYHVGEKLTPKGPLVRTTLHPRIKVGYKNHVVQREVEIGDRVLKLKFPMALGMDLPTRNQLKRLEEDNPRLYLLLWKDSDVSIRYAFVVDCTTGCGIWSNYFCDRVMLPV